MREGYLSHLRACVLQRFHRVVDGLPHIRIEVVRYVFLGQADDEPIHSTSGRGLEVGNRTLR